MIDHHVHLNDNSEFGFVLDKKTLSDRMDRFGVSKSIVFCSPNAERKKNPYYDQNEKIYLDSLSDCRFVPFIFVNPFLDDIDTLVKQEEKFRGFKLHPRAQGMEYSFESFLKNRNDVLDFLMESYKPVIFHTGYRDISRIKHLEFFIKNSNKPVALAHAGDLIDSDLELISKYENVFIDVSPMQTMLDQNYFVDVSERFCDQGVLNPHGILDYLGNLFGKERVVWGSDSPWSDNLIPDGYAKEVYVGRLMEQKGFKFSYLDI